MFHLFLTNHCAVWHVANVTNQNEYLVPALHRRYGLGFFPSRSSVTPGSHMNLFLYQISRVWFMVSGQSWTSSRPAQGWINWEVRKSTGDRMGCIKPNSQCPLPLCSDMVVMARQLSKHRATCWTCGHGTLKHNEICTSHTVTETSGLISSVWETLWLLFVNYSSFSLSP